MSDDDTDSESDDNDLGKKDKATPIKRGHSLGLKSVTKKAKILKAKSNGMGVNSGSTANVSAIDLTTDNAPSPFSVHDEKKSMNGIVS